MLYFGLSLCAVSLGYNDHLNFVISGLVEFPAYLAVQFLSDRIGRKIMAVVPLILTGATLLLTMAVPEDPGMYVWSYETRLNRKMRYATVEILGALEET